MTDLARRAEALRALHVPGEPLVLVNVWDAASARAVAAAPGTRAIATASHSIAAALGAEDGEALTREAMLAAVRSVCAAVALPVTADLERGYGADAAGVGATVTAALAVGAVGANIEDSLPDGTLRPTEEAAERIAAARAAASAEDVPFVINARTDAYLLPGLERGARVEQALERGAAYAAAGGDCIFVPGVRDRAVIAELAARMGAPVSIFAGAGSPPLAELAAAGVARVSIGPGGMGIAYAALRRAASELPVGGPWPADLAFRP